MPEVIIPVTVLLFAASIGLIYAGKWYSEYLRNRAVQRNWEEALAEIDAANTERETAELLASLDLPDLPAGLRWHAHICGPDEDSLHVAVLGTEDGEEVIYREGLLLSVDDMPPVILEALLQKMAEELLDGLTEE